MSKNKTPCEADTFMWPLPLTFTARYNLRRNVYRVDDTTYLVEGPSEYSRGAMDTDGSFFMVDFEGGPYIQKGMSLSLALHDDLPAKIIKDARFVTYEDRCKLLGIKGEGEPKETYAYCKVTV